MFIHRLYGLWSVCLDVFLVKSFEIGLKCPILPGFLGFFIKNTRFLDRMIGFLLKKRNILLIKNLNISIQYIENN